MPEYFTIIPPDKRLYGQPLSTRETEIAEMVAQGLLNKEIAIRLGLSEQTVKNHITNIFHKTGLRNRTAVSIQFNNGTGNAERPKAVDDKTLRNALTAYVTTRAIDQQLYKTDAVYRSVINLVEQKDG